MEQNKNEGGTCEISVVLPCLNEAETLADCITEIQKGLQLTGVVGEIVIADNGSTDGSREIARQYNVKLVDVTRKGYGAALDGGIKAASGKYIIMGDADSSYNFLHIPRFYEKLKAGYELVMGNRFKGRIEKGAMPWKNRYIGNPFLSFLGKLFFRSRASDFHCGIRGFSSAAYRRMCLCTSGMEYASEMVVKATLKKMKVTEVPTDLRPDGRSRLPHLRPWQDGWRHLKFMFMYSPLWLYFIPGLLSFGLSLLIMIPLLSTPSGTMFRLGLLKFGDHWMPIGSALFIISYQLLILGIIALFYHRSLPFFQDETRRQQKLFKRLTVDNMALLGLLLIASGVAFVIHVIVVWQQNNFGELSMIRSMIIGITLIVCGFMTFSGGFLLGIISEEKNPR